MFLLGGTNTRSLPEVFKGEHGETQNAVLNLFVLGHFLAKPNPGSARIKLVVKFSLSKAVSKPPSIDSEAHL